VATNCIWIIFSRHRNCIGDFGTKAYYVAGPPGLTGLECPLNSKNEYKLPGPIRGLYSAELQTTDLHSYSMEIGKSTVYGPVRDRDGTDSVSTTPDVVCDYNKHMGYVDQSDQIICGYSMHRRTISGLKRFSSLYLILYC
jgi:hypothetical protein